jgi:hypothetical protein
MAATALKLASKSHAMAKNCSEINVVSAMPTIGGSGRVKAG